MASKKTASGSAADAGSLRRRQWEWLCLTVVLGTVGAFLAFANQSEAERVESAEQSRLQGQVAILAEDVQRNLVAASFSLQRVIDDRLLPPGELPAIASRRLRALVQAMPGVRYMSVIDAQGTAIAASRAEFLGQNFRQRAYFQEVSRAPDSSVLYVSAPFVSLQNDLIVVLARAVRDAQGNVAFMVIASLDPNYFTSLLRPSMYTPDVWAYVAHGNGVQLLNFPSRPGIDGTRLDQPQSLFSAHMRTGQPASVQSGEMMTTKERRVMAFRTIAPAELKMSRPLVLGLSRLEQEIQAPVRRHAAASAGFFAALVAVCSAALLAFQTRRRDQEAHARERDRADLLLRLEHSVALALAEAPDIGAGGAAALRAIGESQRWRTGRFWLVDEVNHALHVVACWRAGPGAVACAQPTGATPALRLEENLAGRVLASGQPLWVAQSLHELRVVDPSLPHEAGGGAYLVPVGLAGTMGVLSFGTDLSHAPDARVSLSTQIVCKQLAQFVQRKRAEAAGAASERFVRSTLDSLHKHVCVVDAQGVIVETNLQWKAFARDNQGVAASCLEGANYLEVCERAQGEGAEQARMFAQGIRDVLAGVVPNFSMEYRADAPGERRWFIGRVSRFAGAGPAHAVVAHENITARKEAMLRLHESERRFSELLGNIQLISAMVDCDGRITYCNDYLLRLTGWTREELMGRDWFEVLVAPQDRAVRESFNALLHDDAQARHRENDIVTRSGERRRIRWSNSVLRSADGGVVGAASIGEDITDSALAQQRLRRLTDFYAALSRTNAAMVRISDPQKLYEEVCTICVEYGHASMAYVALVSGDNLQPVAWAGAAEPFLAELQAPLQPESARGPIAMAVVDGRPYICNDFLADARTMAWRARAHYLGTQASAAFPLRRGQRVVGALSLHVAEKDYFDAQLVALLEEMMADLSFALDSHDRDVAARESAMRLALAAQSGKVGFWDWDLQSDTMFYSDEWKRQLGYEPHELTDSADEWRSRVHPEDARATGEAIRDFIENPRDDHAMELRLRHRDGSYRWTLAHASLLRDAQGKPVRMLGSQIDITERKQAESRIAYLATHDDLTGLPNRALVRDRIAQGITHARRAGRALAILVIDLDRFKAINDGYGHPFGDALLRAAGQRLEQATREGDTVARSGGDEFVLLLSDLQKSSDVYAVTQKILDSFALPLRVDGREVYVTVSVGASVYPQNGEDAQSLIANADVAMYRAKGRGGNSYQFFNADMSEGLRQRVEFEHRLRQALTQQQLHLAYQPKVDLASGRIVGAEALLRWTHPELGDISPARFIPLAEETGLIVPIGEWVLNSACDQARRWLDAGLAPLVVSVNVSARQFQHQDLVALVLRALEQTRLPAQLLELELTESMLAQDTERAVQTVDRLKSAGVHMSIDDFGTGYSSLSYLKRFRVNTLKIDQSFVRDMLTDPDDAAITLAVISLARSLRMRVIAEGVEPAAHCDLLRQQGCDEIQGYFFSRPLAPNAFAALLQEDRRLTLPLPA